MATPNDPTEPDRQYEAIGNDKSPEQVLEYWVEKWDATYSELVELRGRHERDMVVFNDNIVIAERQYDELVELRALLVVERARANQAETEVKRLEAYIDTWESRDGDGDYALLLRAEAALERVKALFARETEGLGGISVWVNGATVRAALGAVLVDTNPGYDSPNGVNADVCNPETTTEGTE